MTDNIQCCRCHKSFDPSYEFIEDINLCEVLLYYLDSDMDNFCPECLEEFNNQITTAAEEFKRGN
jgi:hypothetical protein